MALISAMLVLVGSFARTVGDAGSAAFGGLVIDETLAQPIWGTALAWNLAAFVGALILVHCLLGLLAWAMAHVTRAAFPGSPHGLTTWTLMWLVGVTSWVFIANAAWYPLSSFGEAYSELVQRSLFGISVFEAATACLLGGAALTTGRLALRLATSGSSVPRWVLVVCSAALIPALASFGVPSKPRAANDSRRPHIIFIGLDAVRTDVVGNANGSSTTPALDRFLASSTVFTDTITPLARTFSAWVAIVSGKHPHTTGAVVNLLPRELVDEGDTLPRLLREAGYRSIYAIDEVRFSNLDESYGFDEMLSPPIGATDFFLGFFGDAPLANLVANTRAGLYLFPYAHGNRAAAATYDPETFIERLEKDLRFDQPTFLAVHLTLVHWPYVWSTAREHSLNDPATNPKVLYDAALARLDGQFDELLRLLERRGVLENAIVVVLSDHGESLGEPPSYVADPPAAPSQVFGHGTNVFAKAQYQTLLAMRAYGTTLLPLRANRAIGAPTSLEDLTPTFADLFDIEPKRPFDGVSLLPLLRGGEPPALDRIRFMETEFNPPGVSTGGVMRQSALAGAVKYYQVDPVTDRVSIRTRYLEQILNGRQYAALSRDSLLASVPSLDKRTQHLLFATADKPTAEWLSEPPDGRENQVAFELWTALSDRFTHLRERPVTPPPEAPPPEAPP